jgi:Zn finger protein HypA/HybF involved in hydrogenase expression
VAEPVRVGSDVSAGTYRCTNCGYEMSTQSVVSLPPCPKCDGPYSWATITGGDARDDPYPDGT